MDTSPDRTESLHAALPSPTTGSGHGAPMATRDAVDTGRPAGAAEVEPKPPAPVSGPGERARELDVGESAGHDSQSDIPATDAEEPAQPSAAVSEEPGAGTVEEAASPSGSTLTARLDSLRDDLAELARLEERHTTIIERLHSENTTLRQGELTQALKPIVLDLARLHDDVASVIAKGGDELRRAAAIPMMILNVLERHGITQICPEVGQPFDGKLHQALTVVSAEDTELDGMIARVQRAGFSRDGIHLVRPAQVDVYRYTPRPQNPTHDDTHTRSEDIG